VDLLWGSRQLVTDLLWGNCCNGFWPYAVMTATMYTDVGHWQL